MSSLLRIKWFFLERDSKDVTWVGVKVFIDPSLLELNLSYRIIDFVQDRIKVGWIEGTFLLFLPELIYNFVGTCEVLCRKLLKTSCRILLLLLLLSIFNIKYCSFLTAKFYEINPFLWQDVLSCRSLQVLEDTPWKSWNISLTQHVGILLQHLVRIFSY